jgi:arylsulfatase A-like enzyme
MKPLLCLLLLASAAFAADRPNILFIMTDDHAAHAMSCYGSKVNATPNMDRIARDGIRFTNAFVTNSICTPSRATILTGKYSHANGTPVFNRFDGSQQTVAKLLQAAGYHTGVVGKWHLGSDPTGFDRWIVLPGQGAYRDPAFLVKAGRLTVNGYATDVIADLGIEWLETRPKDKPFFLMLHHKAPHRAWEPDEKNRALFASRTIPEPPTLFDDYRTRPAALPENRQTVARDLTRRDLKLAPPADLTTPQQRNAWLAAKPESVEIENTDGTKNTLTGEALVHWKYQRYMRDYLACVQGVDDNIGRVLDYLDRTGLAKSTVVFYTSDNGFFLGDLGLYDKRFMYEPSLRVPLLVRGPGLKAGAVAEQFALNNDYAPTFLELAGLPVPAEMHGRSLLPLLRGEAPADWRTSMYYRYYHDPGDHNTRSHLGIRTATHKLIHYWKKDAWEMYDLAADRNEQRNVADDPAHAAKLAELKAELKRLQSQLRDEEQFANEIPPSGVGGLKAGVKPLGVKTAAEAIALSVEM